jgi:hypothetical protein
MDLHRGPLTFTLGLKLGVGILDSVGREWLHNGAVYPEPDEYALSMRAMKPLSLCALCALCAMSI